MDTQLPTLEHEYTDSAAICALLSRYKFNYQNERLLQDGIESIFKDKKIQYKRELHINRKDRPDFIVTGGIAIEVKIKGSQSQFLRQASRYLLDENITGLIIIGTPYWISSVPTGLHNKPISKVRLLGSML